MRTYIPFLCAAGLLLAGASPLGAQERDPTQPPARALATPAELSQAAAAPEVDSAAVVVRDGKPYLMAGTRLYGVGQTIGPYKIERIGETEIWLRNAKVLRKIQRFNGIERHIATERPTP
jgi:hypothetical protein